MAKLSAKQIKLRKAQSAVNNLTNTECANKLFATLAQNPFLCATVGISIAEILKHLKEGTFDKKAKLGNFVAFTCNDVQNRVHSMYPQDFTKPYPIEAIGAVVMQLLEHAELLKGVSAPLIPKVEHGKLTVEIKVDDNGVELTEESNEFWNKADSACNLFTAQQNFAPNFANLTMFYAQKIVDKYKA